MDRSPWRAGASAPPCFPRSFAISLAIAIAVTQTSVCGFSIRGRHTTLDSVTDLLEVGSSQLEVKYEMGGKNEKINDIKHNNNEFDTTVIAINTTDQIKQVSNETSFNLLSSSTEGNAGKHNNNNNKEQASNAYETSEVGTIKSSDTNTLNAINIKMVREPAPNITVPPIIDDNETAKVIKDQKEQSILTPKTDNYTTTENIISDSETNLAQDLSNDDFENLTPTDNVSSASEFSTLETSKGTETASTSTDSFNSAPTIDLYSTLNDVSISTTDITLTISEMYTKTDDTTYTDLTETSPYTTNPTWKKYTTIKRKSPIITNTVKENMAKSETAQTMNILENIVKMAPTSSLESLRQNFLNGEFTTPWYQDETNNDTEDYLLNAPTLEPLKTTQMMSLMKLDIVSSKRGGYLDNTETTTQRPLEATTVKLDKAKTSYTEIFATEYNTKGYSDGSETKKASSLESQSQLDEDAIKEELLKEKTLNDNEEIAKRYSDDGVKFLGDIRNKQNSQAAVEVEIDDVLSVKPIINEKKINISLYAVNPNYKPLKKIEVQPPKQFVRDPDDNSWRNESISSLGIVFKPKNSSKSFKQVLKNKTETELNNTSDKDNKGEVPDLRVRLEKIAEVRKSKKKKTNTFGEVVYTDYDSAENTNAHTNETASPVTSFLDSIFSLTTPETPEPNVSVKSMQKDKIDIFNIKDPSLLTTTKPKKFFNIAEYYDTTDEYDADYLKVTKMDLKKFTKVMPVTEKSTTPPPEVVYTTPLTNYLPERMPTVQYFPPTKKVTQKIKVGDYDTDFQKKLNLFTYKDTPKNVIPVSYTTVSSSQLETEPHRVTAKPQFTPVYKPGNFDKNLYLTQQTRVTEPQDGYSVGDGNFNRASYVIKHYKDFINEAVKDSDEDRNIDYLPFTESPVRGVTINELAKLTEKDAKTAEEDYGYDIQFRKDVMNRFVDNFNQNSERFKVDFPILYNSSVVHRKIPDSGKVLAASTAYLRRQYELVNTRPGHYLANGKLCEPNCEKFTVDLSPDYELHYYVPEQEEKEEIDNRQITASYRYRNTQL